MRKLLAIFILIGLKIYELILIPIWWIIKRPYRIVRWVFKGKVGTENGFLLVKGYTRYPVWEFLLRFIGDVGIIFIGFVVVVFEVYAVGSFVGSLMTNHTFVEIFKKSSLISGFIYFFLIGFVGQIVLIVAAGWILTNTYTISEFFKKNWKKAKKIAGVK